MWRNLTLSLMLCFAAAPASGQMKKLHILFSSNTQGYVDPCG